MKTTNSIELTVTAGCKICFKIKAVNRPTSPIVIKNGKKTIKLKTKDTNYNIIHTITANAHKITFYGDIEWFWCAGNGKYVQELCAINHTTLSRLICSGTNLYTLLLTGSDKLKELYLCDIPRDRPSIIKLLKDLPKPQSTGIIFMDEIDIGYYHNQYQIVSVMERRGWKITSPTDIEDFY